MSIEERANKAYPIYGEGYFDNDIKNECFHAYCKGAREQRQVDIDKAWIWFESIIFPSGVEKVVAWRQAFIKAMEE